jgi:hypothetical protein
VSGVIGGRTVDEQQVELVGQFDQCRRRVPRGLARQRRVDDARDVVQCLAPQLLVHERGPVAVVLERDQAAAAAFAQQPREHDRADAAAALDDPPAGTVDDLVADRDHARGPHRAGAPGQIAAAVEQRAQDVPGMQVLLAPPDRRRAHGATALQSSS